MTDLERMTEMLGKLQREQARIERTYRETGTAYDMGQADAARMFLGIAQAHVRSLDGARGGGAVLSSGPAQGA